MKIARFGNVGSERPAVMVNQTQAVYVDHLIKDWNRPELESGALEEVKSADLSAQTPFDIAGLRIASPVARPTKLICIGLNYARHAAESGMTPPPEPVVFMKAPDCLIGPNDDIVIPPHSTATDYEVELAIVIGQRALYLKDESEARSHILGYSISQDVSERHWQIERAGQWVKGKSFPTFNPMGPTIVTEDEFTPDDVRLYCTVGGEKRQDSRTSDLIYGIDHIVWYLSQFMELFPGDIINTGTPEGVGMGFKPTKYLTAGQEVVTGIEGLGEMRSQTKAS
jgi:2-keto-4-pentenoate hydratase/2-oxohepta-3-ene-1,7-dioic acid hydratase in catechol pathway